MALQQVRSYKSSDGTLHSERKPALVHETKITIRGFLQSKTPPGLGNAQNFTPTQAANLITDHLEEFCALLAKNRDAIRRCKE